MERTLKSILNCTEPTVQLEMSNTKSKLEELDAYNDAILEGEIRKATENLEYGKAAGDDGIKGKIIFLNYTWEMVVKERTKLCNNICEMSRVPEAQ